ncbi:MAG: FtsX-like permease family protein [Clostridiales bacterium]|nr:FtsX-like permease family protein [Clostridiales bacterium]
MDILNKKLLRDLWQSKGQFLSVLVIVTIGVMFYTGINSAFNNLNGASEKYYREYRLADLFVSLYRAPENVENKILSLPFVKTATGRIVKDVKLDIDNETAAIRIITLPDDKKDVVNDIMIKSGRYFSSSENNQCLVEEGFYKAHNLKPGDEIYPVVGGKEVKLKVIGSVRSPEYVYPLREGELVPDNKKFGIFYIKKSFGQSIFGFGGSINSLSILVKDTTDLDKAKDDVKKYLKEFGVNQVVDRDGQISAKMLSEEMKGLKASGGSFPIVFFIMAAVIIYITMGRMVENQKTQIGVLKAFGFNNFQVLLHYLSYSVLIGVAGSVMGAVFGMMLGKGFTDMENAYFNLPAADMKMYPELVFPAAMLTLSFCIISGYNACKKGFRMTPSEAMRPRAPVAGKKILVEKIKIFWNNITYFWKMILRNIFRNKRRALLTSTGVIFATALTFIAFGEMDSIQFLIDQQYGNIQNYDIKVNFSKFLNDEQLSDLKTIPHIVQYEPLVETGVEISNGWKKKDVSYTALVSNPQIYKVTDKDGNAVHPPQSGILLPDKLAKTLGVKTGDTVYVKSYFPGKEKKEMKVKGVIAQYIGSSVYSSMDALNYLTWEGRIANSAVIKIDSSKNEEEVIKQLKKMTAVISVQSKSDSLRNLTQNMGSTTSFIGVMVLLAAVLAIAVIYNIATINIFERQRELATLKVLGFKDVEVKSLIFNENYIITVFGILVGLPFGKWLANAMFSMYDTDAYNIVFVAGAKSYLISAALTITFTILANFILMKKIKTISMVEVLKVMNKGI